MSKASKIQDRIKARVDRNKDKLPQNTLPLRQDAPQAIVEPKVSTDPHYGRRGPHGYAKYWSSED